MGLDLIRKDIKHFGLAKTIFDLTLRGINHTMLFKVLRGMHADAVDPKYLKIDERYKHGFLDGDTLKHFVDKPEYELSKRFLDNALERGDECYGIIDGEILAYYGWYSAIPTVIDNDDLLLHFSSGYIYMYKAFTHPVYRGQRLHPIGLNLALKSFLERGYKGLLAYAESNNYSSLSAGFKMGHKNFGNIYLARLFDKYLIYSDKGCQSYEFKLEHTKPPQTKEPDQVKLLPSLNIKLESEIDTTETQRHKEA